MTEPLSPFSEAIRAEINRRRGTSKRGKPTQEEMAAAIGRTQPYVSERIAGIYPWGTEDLDRLAPLFGVSVFELVAAARNVSGEAHYSLTPEPPSKDLPIAAKQGRRKIDQD